MTTTTLAPLVVGPTEDRAPFALEIGGHRIIGKILSDDTAGQFSAGIVQAPPLTGPPLHQHTNEDEWFYILKGEFWLQIGDEFIKAGPGASVFAPRDVPHTWQNFGPGTAEFLGVVTPGGLENFFLDAIKMGGSMEAVGKSAERHGVKLLGPPMMEKPQETGK
jgi:quercetin dioxygenase-like cupin family protein